MPAVELSKPASVNPGLILDQISDYKVTLFGAAPAFMESVIDCASKCEESLHKIKNLEGLLVGGAPTPYRLIEKIVHLLPSTDSLVLYGSSEAEPIAKIKMSEVIEIKDQVKGYVVGYKSEHIKLKICELSSLKEVSQGEIGEIVVSGDHVVRRYLNNPEANLETKIKDSYGRVWHRTGDLAYMDKVGRIVLQSRVKDVFKSGDKTIYPFQYESLIDQNTNVEHSALMSLNGGITLLYTGLNSDKAKSEIRTLLSSMGLSDVEVKWIKQMPMDKRHNSKIE